MTIENDGQSERLFTGLETQLLHGRIGRREFIQAAAVLGGGGVTAAAVRADKAHAIVANQRERRAGLLARYDYIVCGAGAAGSVVARRLAEDPDRSVLLIEAGGSDDNATVTLASSYPLVRFPELFWKYEAQLEAGLNGRAMVQLMGKVLGGGSSVNTMVWARGHQADFDRWAELTGDAGWNYENALRLYRKIEDWQGTPDPRRRGQGGPVWVQTAQNPCPLAPAMIEAATAFGIPAFDDHNGEMMEGDGGAALANLIVKDGNRRNMPVSYLYPVLDQPNITLLAGAVVQRVEIEHGEAVGVRFEWLGRMHYIRAERETILSMGAFNTPRTLMLSGIGDEAELRRLNIPIAGHLPGVGANFQDHSLVATCLWEGPEGIAPNNNKAEATFFWKSDASLVAPDIQPFLIEVPHLTEKHSQYGVGNAWSLSPSIIRPRSRGRIRLCSADANDGLDLEWNPLGDVEERRTLRYATELCRDIGNSAGMKEFARREILPGPVYGNDLDDFIRNGVTSYGHATCTAKMGRDPMAVVDSELRVHGIGRLRIADGSVMPEITSGNTMAPCVLIGERAAELILA